MVGLISLILQFCYSYTIVNEIREQKNKTSIRSIIKLPSKTSMWVVTNNNHCYWDEMGPTPLPIDHTWVFATAWATDKIIPCTGPTSSPNSLKFASYMYILGIIYWQCEQWLNKLNNFSLHVYDYSSCKLCELSSYVPHT